MEEEQQLEGRGKAGGEAGREGPGGNEGEDELPGPADCACSTVGGERGGDCLSGLQIAPREEAWEAGEEGQSADAIEALPARHSIGVGHGIGGGPRAYSPPAVLVVAAARPRLSSRWAPICWVRANAGAPPAHAEQCGPRSGLKEPPRPLALQAPKFRRWRGLGFASSGRQV